MNKVIIKYINVLIFILLLSTIVSGIECEISENNITFVDIKSVLHDGKTGEDSQLVSIQNLQESTLYYIRCRNETSLTNWSYVSATTLTSDWEESRMITLFGILFGFMIFFMFMYFKGDSLTDYMSATRWLQILKPVYFIIALGISYIIVYMLGETATYFGVSDKIVYFLQWLIWPYTLICIILVFLIMLGLTQQATDFKKAVNEGRNNEY